MARTKHYRLECTGEQWAIAQRNVSKKTGVETWQQIKWFSGHRLDLAVRRLIVLQAAGAASGADPTQLSHDVQTLLETAVRHVKRDLADYGVVIEGKQCRKNG